MVRVSLIVNMKQATLDNACERCSVTDMRKTVPQLLHVCIWRTDVDWMVHGDIRDALNRSEPGVRARVGRTRDYSGLLENLIDNEPGRPEIAGYVIDLACSRQRDDDGQFRLCRHGYGA
jgi:hypothetical protein